MGCAFSKPPHAKPDGGAPVPTAAPLTSLELKAEKQEAHGRSVTSVVFSPDGKSIVSGSSDMAIKVWDAGASALARPPTLNPNLTAPVLAAASLELKAEQQDAHGNFVNSVAFSPDGKTIVSGSEDLTIKVWDAGVSALTHPNP